MAGGAAAWWAMPATAQAHIEVSAQSAQAGAGPVVVEFSAESESQTAGITGVKTQLPAGITPDQVSLAAGPSGWVLQPTADGFQIAGPAVPAGTDASYSITIAQLPATSTELVFKTLQRYADGREDAWIEEATDAVPDPAMPAPVLFVTPADPASSPTASRAAAPPTSSTPTPVATAPATSAADQRDDNSALVAVGVVLALGVGAAAVARLWFRKRTDG
jgi:uncharacterized protein YcnI